MSEKRGPLQIIADLLPQGPDTWISDRHDMAIEILMALDREGFVIHARDVRVLTQKTAEA